MNVFIRGVFNGSKRASVQVAILHALGKFKILRISRYPIKQCFGSGFSGLLESNPDPGALKKDKKVRLS